MDKEKKILSWLEENTRNRKIIWKAVTYNKKDFPIAWGIEYKLSSFYIDGDDKVLSLYIQKDMGSYEITNNTVVLVSLVKSMYGNKMDRNSIIEKVFEDINN